MYRGNPEGGSIRRCMDLRRTQSPGTRTQYVKIRAKAVRRSKSRTLTISAKPPVRVGVRARVRIRARVRVRVRVRRSQYWASVDRGSEDGYV